MVAGLSQDAAAFCLRHFLIEAYRSDKRKNETNPSVKVVQIFFKGKVLPWSGDKAEFHRNCDVPKN